jgi:hypothetical protein
MANEMRDAIKGNPIEDIRAVAIAGDAALAAAILGNTEPADTVTVADTANRFTGTNVEACLAEIAGAGRTSETVKGNNTLIVDHIADTTAAHAASAISITASTGAGAVYTAIEVDGALLEIAGAGRTTETVKGNNTLILANTAAIDALQRTGSTVEVAGVVTDAGRDVTLTVKDGDGTAVARYSMIGVKVTKGDGNGVDTGDPAVIDTDLVTSTGLIVKASSGEQLVPSNGAAISNAGNANLIAFTKADGTLVVTPTAKTNNLFVFVHFIMPDGTVEKSAEIKLKEV